MLNHGTAVVGFGRPTLILISTVFWVATIVVAALAADRYGAKRVFVIGAITAVSWPLPLFGLVNTGDWLLALIAFIVAARWCRGSWPGPRAGCSPSSSRCACATAASPSPTSWAA